MQSKISDLNVIEWLKKAKLQQYAAAFEAHKVDGEKMLKLTVPDLIQLGMVSELHRLKFTAEREHLERTLQPSSSSSSSSSSAFSHQDKAWSDYIAALQREGQENIIKGLHHLCRLFVAGKVVSHEDVGFISKVFKALAGRDMLKFIKWMILRIWMGVGSSNLDAAMDWKDTYGNSIKDYVTSLHTHTGPVSGMSWPARVYRPSLSASSAQMEEEEDDEEECDEEEEMPPPIPTGSELSFPEIHQNSILHDIRRIRTRILSEERALKKRRLIAPDEDKWSIQDGESNSSSSSSSSLDVDLLYNEMRCLAKEVERFCLLQVGHAVGRQLQLEVKTAVMPNRAERAAADFEKLCEAMTTLSLDTGGVQSLSAGDVIKLAQKRALEFPNVSDYIQQSFPNLRTLDLSKIGISKLSFELRHLNKFIARNCPELENVTIKCEALTALDLTGCSKLSCLSCAFPRLIDWKFPVTELRGPRGVSALPRLVDQYGGEHSLDTARLEALQRQPTLLAKLATLESTERVALFFQSLSFDL